MRATSAKWSGLSASSRWPPFINTAPQPSASSARPCSSISRSVSLITPNLPEAAALLDAPHARNEREMLEQGRALLALVARMGGVKQGGRFRQVWSDQRHLRQQSLTQGQAAALLDAPHARNEREMLEQGRALLALGCGAVLMTIVDAGSLPPRPTAADRRFSPA
jgi:hydroxymethylpyrimidine/phosphomethylpyrimidine kinase